MAYVKYDIYYIEHDGPISNPDQLLLAMDFLEREFQKKETQKKLTEDRKIKTNR